MLSRLWLTLENEAVIQADNILSQLRMLVADETAEYAVRQGLLAVLIVR